jgi:cyclopropane fatty-acyl-phospholipid synthase-like methyltransferase
MLDLGSGKGAISINLAKQFGFRAVGIDASRPFLKVAKQKAIEFKVQDLCQFIYGDIREYVKERRDYDLVVYASLGGVLGNFKEIIDKTRNCVRTDGYIIIDDGYLKGTNKVNRIGYNHYVSHQETVKQLTSFGDRVIQEISTAEITTTINLDYMKVIKKRANAAIQKFPNLKDAIEQYIENQEMECDIIDNYIEGALWVIQRLD